MQWPNTCAIGDCREILESMIADGVRAQMCVTSPPYWGLRDYGMDAQLGLEATPEEFIANLVGVFRLVREVLADDGTLWVNMGDSYNTQPKTFSGLKPKDLCGMPWRLAFALQADGWYLRSDIIWHKPNPMPESVTDRPTKSHEYLFLLSKKTRYYYDSEAVKEPAVSDHRAGNKRHKYQDSVGFVPGGPKMGIAGGLTKLACVEWKNRNRRTVWTIGTEPYTDAHFATFPRKLVEPCIMAGTSERGHCPGCGGRWERVTETEYVGKVGRSDTEKYDGKDAGFAVNPGVGRAVGYTQTLGWRATCDCLMDPAPDIVLDPFMGSGTVAHVAQALGRNWIGIELNPDYVKMQQKLIAQGAFIL